jgi:hypothetical protein
MMLILIYLIFLLHLGSAGGYLINYCLINLCSIRVRGIVLWGRMFGNFIFWLKMPSSVFFLFIIIIIIWVSFVWWGYLLLLFFLVFLQIFINVYGLMFAILNFLAVIVFNLNYLIFLS